MKANASAMFVLSVIWVDLVQGTDHGVADICLA